MTTYFTADLHLGHNNIRTHCNRPFSTVEEMDETIIERWNNTVTNNDTVYILGDFAWNNTKEYVSRLYGKKILIRGNHDKRTQHIEKYFDNVHSLLDIKLDSIKVTLCHYAMMSWNGSFHGAWHLFGHSHGKLHHPGLAMDVGVDNHHFTPLCWEQIKDIMAEKSDELIMKHTKDITGWIRINPSYGLALLGPYGRTIDVTPIHGTQTTSTYTVPIKINGSDRLYIHFNGEDYYFDKDVKFL
jgi:calcineurin-like phosphoesterase family protein